MPASGAKFAQLLTEAIYQLRLREAKSLQILQDEIGYAMGRNGGSIIDYWRRGNLPSKLPDLERLAGILAQRGSFEQAWLEAFLSAGGYPDPARIGQALAQPAAPSPGRAALPRPYRQLIGREALAAQLLGVLADSEGRWVIGIDGLGGIGKTALALDVTQRVIDQQLMSQVVWISAAQQPSAQPAAPLTFEGILTAIGRQLEIAGLTQLSTDDKFQRIQAIMKHAPVLLALDNLETAGEPQHDLLEKLRPLLQPSKLLLTSRLRFKGDVYTVRLTGLAPEQAAAFIQQDAAEKGLAAISQAAPQDLQPIIAATGGSPLAMKLVVSQLAALPLEVVLDHLQSVTTLSTADEDEYIRLYMFIFHHSWSLIDQAARQLLVALARFVPSNGCDWRAMQHISDLGPTALVQSIDALWRLSLLELHEGERFGQLRYYLHPLTQHFVLSEIAQVL